MKIKNALGILVAVVLSFNQFFMYPVFAQEFVVSGNGEGSSNNISYETSLSTQIQQTNNAEVENKVEAEAVTGENEANSNNGEVKIETGDITQEIAVINSGNSSTAQIGCCEEADPSSASIKGNGEDSDNNVSISDDLSAKVDIMNELKLQNNVSINANTGDNEASDNNGDVTIQTGQINILTQILNQHLNQAYVSASNKNNSFNYFIKNNGSGSTNSISEDRTEENEYFVLNKLYLDNNINNYSNTGGNRANMNSGRVHISTGDIFLDIVLKNKDINTSKILEICCNQATPSPSPSGSPQPTPSGSPSPTPAPSSPPQGSCCSPTTDIPGPGGGGGGSSSGSSSSGGEVLGAGLPATGGFSLWTLTFLALLMLGVGVTLRSDLAYEKFKHKEILGKFTDNFKYYIFGAYLLANIKNLPPAKA